MTQNRWKSPVVWSALAAQVLSILVLLEALTPTQSETLNAVVIAVLQAFVAFGFLNNPENRSGF